MKAMIDSLVKKRRALSLNSKLKEQVYLLAFGVYVAFNFLAGTMYIVLVPSNIIRIGQLVGVLIAVIKIFFFDIYDDKKEVLLISILGLFLWVCSLNAEVMDLFYYYVLVVAARGVDFRRILRLFIGIISVGTVVVIVSAKLGIIIGLTNSRDGATAIRYALGFVYTTDFAARIFYLLLTYVTFRKFKLLFSEYIIAISMVAFVYIVTDTKLDTLLMLLIIMVALFKKYITKALIVMKAKVINILTVLSILGIIGLTYLYDKTNILLVIINKILTRRLEFGHAAFTKYNVTLFGQEVVQNGNGGIHKGYFEYFYIDSSYLRILMMNGFVIFIIVLIFLLSLSSNFINKKMYSLEIMLLFVLLSSLIDQHLIEISFNIIFIAFFANTNFFEEGSDSEIE
ncbi:hypothetical protein [Ligilactobacillus equi]|uniref:hypothetical protein n=1 Tax=Ligilactobacillus equi TaxID=137357 RepID=UPI000704CAB9|nr:hypothetical protein [Ligilactobacillus equi]